MTTALITGANRGLGLEFVRQFLDAGVRVIATCREPAKADALQELARANPQKVHVCPLDASNQDAIRDLKAQLGATPIDYLIANAGMSPNKKAPLAAIDKAEWLQVFLTNTIGPAYLAAAFEPSVAASARKIIAFVSTRMTLIPENTAGSYYMYRSSKGALNQVIHNLALDHKADGVTVLALHPGFVRTDMGGPSATVGVQESVAGLVRVLTNATHADNGKFFDFRGHVLTW
jgi:NAD(P)-dependent dehydrogenase (short-subunit alcohol dehydrogenase family)